MEIIRKKIKVLMKNLQHYQELEDERENYEAQEVLDCLDVSLSISRSLLIYAKQLESKIEEMKK